MTIDFDHGRGEQIAALGNGLDVGLGVVAQRLPDFLDALDQRIVGHVDARARRCRSAPPWNQPARVLHQIGQHVERFRPQRQRRAVAAQAGRPAIEDKWPETIAFGVPSPVTVRPTIFERLPQYLDHFTGISSVLHDLWRRMCAASTGPRNSVKEEPVNETVIEDPLALCRCAFAVALVSDARPWPTSSWTGTPRRTPSASKSSCVNSANARGQAMLHVAMFEAVNAIDKRYAPYKLNLAADPERRAKRPRLPRRMTCWWRSIPTRRPTSMRRWRRRSPRLPTGCEIEGHRARQESRRRKSSRCAPMTAATRRKAIVR